MQADEEYRNERLGHLGIVAGVCREIGLGEWLDERAGPNRFLKDPLFLTSSVFVKNPRRLIALSFIMVLCLLIYCLAEQRLHHRLHESGQTIPNQLNKPTDKPTSLFDTFSISCVSQRQF